MRIAVTRTGGGGGGLGAAYTTLRRSCGPGRNDGSADGDVFRGVGRPCEPMREKINARAGGLGGVDGERMGGADTGECVYLRGVEALRERNADLSPC